MLDQVPGEVAHPEQHSTERRRLYASAASDTDLPTKVFCCAESVSCQGLR